MKRSRNTNLARNRQPKAIDRSQNPKAAKFPVLTPKTENQKYFFESLEYDTLAIAAGSAGTGKTLLSCYAAAQKLYHGKIKKIILIRAYQPLANRSIGFLPGTAEEKLEPYYRQMLDYLEDFLGKAELDILRKRGAVEICSLETIRGRNWDDSFIIVDEAQSLVADEVKALVTRIGQNSQMALVGDNSGVQSDVKNTEDGLSYLVGIIEKYDIAETGITYFTQEDILRSGITKQFVIAFDAELQEAFRNKKK